MCTVVTKFYPDTAYSELWRWCVTWYSTPAFKSNFCIFCPCLRMFFNEYFPSFEIEKLELGCIMHVNEGEASKNKPWHIQGNSGPPGPPHLQTKPLMSSLLVKTASQTCLISFIVWKMSLKYSQAVILLPLMWWEWFEMALQTWKKWGWLVLKTGRSQTDDN